MQLSDLFHSERKYFVPESMKSLSQWVLWKLEERDGKKTKIPYSANYNGKAKSTAPDTWSDYTQARSVFEKSTSYNGLGFVFTEESEHIFIDIDHCIDENNNLSDLAIDILSAIGNVSFVEVSQSGTGLHLITKGKIKKGFKNQSNGVEMYCSGRYCAITGDALRPCEPSENQSGLNSVYEKYKTQEREKRANRDKNTQQKSSGALTQDIDFIISKARANPVSGREFDALFSGDTSQYSTYNSDGTRNDGRSEADLRLCQILAFWTDCDHHQIDYIFRLSGLYREKWNRQDYREETIERACSSVSETYSEWLERKAEEERTRFKQEESSNEILKRLREIDPEHNPLYEKKEDLSSARLFADIYKDRIRFNATANEWYVYDGKTWSRDIGGMKVEQYAKQLSEAMYLYAFNSSQEYRTFVNKLGMRRQRTIMIADARDFYPFETDELDTQENLLNCQNCVVNLDTLETMPHSPDLLMSKIINADFNPTASSEDFEQFFDEIMCSNEEKKKYVQKICGYALTGTNELEECYMFYGATTRNGKSTLLDTFGYLCGDYALNIAPDTLASKPRDSKTASGDIARLNGCRFLHMGEPPKRMVFDVALLKSLTGRDKITARHLHEREFEFVPVFKLIINTNYLPVVNDDTLFSSGRINVVSFDRHFNEEEQDKTLKKRLRSSENLSGLLNWCLMGLSLYRKEGLTPPPCVRSSTESYRADSDKMGRFIADCLEKNESVSVTAGEVYKLYKSWCSANGFGVENKGNFFAELRTKNLLFESGTVRGKTVRNVVKGYSITAEGYDFLDGEFKEVV